MTNNSFFSKTSFPVSGETAEKKTGRFFCSGREYDFGERTYIMGILNVTPNSFYDGNFYAKAGSALKMAEKMVEEGADFIDVGGESTRPGAESVSSQEEIKRIIPVIRDIKKNFPVPISVDTYKGETADAALGEGASLVNDVSGLRHDPEMAKTISRHNASVVIMHMQGCPQTMQDSPEYNNLLKEIKEHLAESVAIALEAGIHHNGILVDPGIGFGKTLSHNIEIIKNISTFLDLNKPILLGLSRKSFLGQIAPDLAVKDRLEGSLAASVIAILNGANVLRTHDVKETKRAAEIADFFRKQ